MKVLNMKIKNFIDNIMGYRGEVMFKYRPISFKEREYMVGERVGQLIIMPYPHIEFEEADELSKTERSTGGYGSSGK